MKEKVFFISGNTPSSKNDTMGLKTGAIIKRPNVQRWLRYTRQEWSKQAKEFSELIYGLTPPVDVEFTFIRNSERLFDEANVVQAVTDCMTDYGWINDDNYCLLRLNFGEHRVDKQNAGVEIRVIKTKTIEYL